MDVTKLLTGLVGLAKQVAPLIPFGQPAVTIADAILGEMKDISETTGADDATVAEFEVERDALEAAVNAHARKTADSLGDG